MCTRYVWMCREQRVPGPKDFQVSSHFLHRCLVGVLAIPLVMWCMGIRLYVVQSGSMLPSLTPGSLVVTIPINYDNVQVGSIVCFERGGQLVSHRVKARDGSGLITQGDNNPSVDPGVVGREALQGQVVACVPCAGWLILLLRSFPLLIAGVVTLGCALYLALHSKRRHKTIG